MIDKYPDFAKAIEEVIADFKSASQLVHTEKWQGVDISNKPEMATQELLNYNFAVMLQGEDLEKYRQDIKPNLPWADDHFMERVCGEPINPGKEWANWPWGNHADKFRDANGQFNHNYMERYWPKAAGITDQGELVGTDYSPHFVAEMKQAFKEAGDHYNPSPLVFNRGIRYPYGDLNDVVEQLFKEPNTRQAYMPIFFPEDTGAIHGGRVPCSLGYHFIHRYGYLHINYYLRSCEVYRHFRDDCYLTVRLLLWVLGELRKKDSKWNDVKPGFYTMNITSFHCFVNDMVSL